MAATCGILCLCLCGAASIPRSSRRDACIDRGIVDGAKCESGVLAIRHACNRLGLLASVFFQSKEPIQSATLDECRLVSISYMVTSPRYFYDLATVAIFLASMMSMSVTMTTK